MSEAASGRMNMRTNKRNNGGNEQILLYDKYILLWRAPVAQFVAYRTLERRSLV